MNHTGTKELETSRLILRRFELSDAGAMFRNWAGDPDVAKYMTWNAHGSISVTNGVLNDWLNSYQRPDFYQWAIVPKYKGEPIGSIGSVYGSEEIKMVHVGYCIGKMWWHQGYTSEAFARVIEFFFKEVKANRIESRHDPGNPNSGMVMLKCGLSYEGRSRQSDTNNQGLCDAMHYAILAEDYI